MDLDHPLIDTHGVIITILFEVTLKNKLDYKFSLIEITFEIMWL